MLEDKIGYVAKKIIIPVALGIGLAAGYLSGCGKEESHCCQELQCGDDQYCDDRSVSENGTEGVYCMSGSGDVVVQCCQCKAPPTPEPTTPVEHCHGYGC